MTRFLGDSMSAYVQYAVAFASILVLLLLLAYILRLITRRRMRATGGGRGRPPRLGVVEVFDVDRNRQLLLLRRDNVEHLVMIGGETDVLIESAIVRAPHARVAAPQADGERIEETPPVRETTRADILRTEPPKAEPPRIEPSPRPAPLPPRPLPTPSGATIPPRAAAAPLPPTPSTTMPPQPRVNGGPPAPRPVPPAPSTTIPPRAPAPAGSASFASRLEDAIKRPAPAPQPPDPSASPPLPPKATTIPPAAIAKPAAPKAPPAPPPAANSRPAENFDLGSLEDEMAKLLGRAPPTKN